MHHLSIKIKVWCRWMHLIVVYYILTHVAHVKVSNCIAIMV